MFRKAIAIPLFILMSQSLINIGLYGYYHLNKKMIAEKLCVNKSKPQMHCNGHCYLSKQLKQVEEKEKQQSQSFKENQEQVLSLHEVFQAAYIPHFIESSRYRPFLRNDITPPLAEIMLPPEPAA